MDINFKINVPIWANWLTVDKFGVIECWENEPGFWPGANKVWGDGRWHNKTTGRRKELMQYNSQCCRGWKNTLRKL